MAPTPGFDSPQIKGILFAFGLVFFCAAFFAFFFVRQFEPEPLAQTIAGLALISAPSVILGFFSALSVACGLAVDYLAETAYNTRQTLARSRGADGGTRFYYLGSDGNPTGPVDAAGLKHLAAIGLVKADTPVCIEGTEAWQAASGIL